MLWKLFRVSACDLNTHLSLAHYCTLHCCILLKWLTLLCLVAACCLWFQIVFVTCFIIRNTLFSFNIDIAIFFMKISYFWYVCIILSNYYNLLTFPNYIHVNRTVLLLKIMWLMHPWSLVDLSWITLYNKDFLKNLTSITIW